MFVRRIALVVNDANKTKDGRYLHTGIKNFNIFCTCLDYFYQLVVTMLSTTPMISTDKKYSLLYVMGDYLKHFINKYEFVNFHDVGEENTN